MSRRLKHIGAILCLGVVVCLTAGQYRTQAHEDDVTPLVAGNASGVVRTVNLSRRLDLNNPFFHARA